MSNVGEIATVLRKNGRNMWLDPEDARDMAVDLDAAGYSKAPAQLPIVGILAQHQPKRPIGVLRGEKTGLAQGCEGCDFEAFAEDRRGEGPAERLWHGFAAHQAKMIREGAK